MTSSVVSNSSTRRDIIPPPKLTEFVETPVQNSLALKSWSVFKFFGNNNIPSSPKKNSSDEKDADFYTGGDQNNTNNINQLINTLSVYVPNTAVPLRDGSEFDIYATQRQQKKKLFQTYKMSSATQKQEEKQNEPEPIIFNKSYPSPIRKNSNPTSSPFQSKKVPDIPLTRRLSSLTKKSLDAINTQYYDQDTSTETSEAVTPTTLTDVTTPEKSDRREFVAYTTLVSPISREHLKLNRRSLTRKDSAPVLPRSASVSQIEFLDNEAVVKPSSLPSDQSPLTEEETSPRKTLVRAQTQTTLSSPNHPSRAKSSDAIHEDEMKNALFPASTLRQRASSKQFWMPDSRVTMCYECLAPFSVIKRKHHCRICGQIFCWKCSNNFISGEKWGYNGTVRVCEYCKNLMHGKSEKKRGENEKDGNIKIYLAKNVDAATLFKDHENVEITTPGEEFNEEPTEASFFTSAPETIVIDDMVTDSAVENQKLEDEESSFGSPEKVNTSLEQSELSESDIRRQSILVPMLQASPFHISTDEFDKEFDEHLKSLEDRALQHLSDIVVQLLQDDSTLDLDWKDVIVGMALRVVNCVIPMAHDSVMDIRHYVQIKKIIDEDKYRTEYVEGVVFKKNFVHKKMLNNKWQENPKILMLSCPIEYHRVENQISSFDVLIPQEHEFLKLLVARIAEKKPDIVLVEKSVSRIAQDMLLHAGISLMVNVKRSVLERISRVTGYRILSSVDETDVPNASGACKSASITRVPGKTIFTIIGSKPDAGCTILLRGKTIKELTKVKKILQFALFVAYNLKLETEFFFDQCGTLLQAPPEIRDQVILSASPCVHFKLGTNEALLANEMTPVSQRTADQIRDQLQSPYTEDENEVFNASPVSDKSYSTMILSPLTHQNIVLLFTKFSNETRREEYEIHPEIIVIAYYTENDMSLGRYLEAKCLNDSIRKDVLGITRSYAHDDGKVIVTVEQSAHMVTTEEDGIMMWGVCKECGRHVTPVIPMSTSTYNYSFGKFLETMFYNRQLRCRTGGCSHLLHRDHIRCFAYKDLIAKFEYRSVIVYDIVVPGNVLTYNEQYEQDCFQKLLQTIGEGVTELFNSFFMVISEMNQKLQYRQCHTALGELLELIRTQQESFWSYFHNISSYKDLPKLNDFVRSVYVAGTNWNESLKEAAEFTPTIANRSSTIIPKIFTTGENDTFVRPTTRLQRPQHLPQTPPKHKYISIILSDNNGQIAVHMSEPPVPSLNLSELKHSVQSVSRLSPDVVQDPDYTSSPLSVVSQSDSVFSVTPSRTPVSPNPIVSDTGRNSPRVLVAPSPVVKPSTVTSNGTPQVKIPLQIENVAAHMYMSSGVNNANVIVYDDEPSTIIAYTLSSKDYDETMTTIKTDETMEQQMLSKEPSHFKFTFQSEKIVSKNASRKKSEFYCTCYYAKQFAALRKAYVGDEDNFLRSLSRCKKFQPTGGKSGSAFIKSWDDRFILKQVSRVELVTFLETGTNYFEYVANTLFHGLPSVLVKILGVFRLGFTYKGKFIKQDLVVMDNLFYGRTLSRTFDLKGGIRNRYQHSKDAVLMDENLLEFIYAGSPLVVKESSRLRIQMSIFNDTLMLSKLNVMDYSLLVGVDNENEELVVGIIDYMRQYTWDKHLETWVKSAGIIGSGLAKIPTVISPKHYKSRFREAMDRYFILNPDKFSGFNAL